jgi:hypothetical protein
VEVKVNGQPRSVEREHTLGTFRSVHRFKLLDESRPAGRIEVFHPVYQTLTYQVFVDDRLVNETPWEVGQD